MTDPATLFWRYQTCADLLDGHVEILVVGDAPGTRFNSAAGRLILAVKDDGSAMWDDIVGATKSLRWRLLEAPQPLAFNEQVSVALTGLQQEVSRLSGTAGAEATRLLDELDHSGREVAEIDRPTGAVLLESLNEIGEVPCAVVVSGLATRAHVEDWLMNNPGVSDRIQVVTPGQMFTLEQPVEQVYVIGPPQIFSTSVFTAPISSQISYIMPEWFGARTLPVSSFTAYADYKMAVPVRAFPVGIVSLPPTVDTGLSEGDLLPLPDWSRIPVADRDPKSDEVLARRVLLSGGYTVFLDDGERIRSLDPSQLPGERVVSAYISAVVPGTFLLLREGQNEDDTMYRAALKDIGPSSDDVIRSQETWKQRLRDKFEEHGKSGVSDQLHRLGVRAADQAVGWQEELVSRPQRDEDFRLLLQWLDVDDSESTFSLATLLRRHRQKAGQAVRMSLEEAIARVELSALASDGHTKIEGGTEGARPLIATRVLAVSPHQEIIQRSKARVLTPDRYGGGKWLE